MPELPEVESVRRGLNKVLIGQTIKNVKVNNGKIVFSHSNIRQNSKAKTLSFINNITNKKIVKVSRRAKNIIIELSDESIILIHLKMTGQLVYVGAPSAHPQEKIIGGHPITESYTATLPNKHTHIVIALDNGTLYYNDIRQFGYVLYYQSLAAAEQNKHFEKMGVEPLEKDFTPEYFESKIKLKNKSIKASLLEQDIVVGCGNIYADEICFASKVSPLRICKTLSSNEIKKIYTNIKKILQDAIDNGGSSISDYLLADGSRGNYANHHKVYGKAGEPCYTCKSPLLKCIVSGRATVYCNVCQK